MGRGTTATYGDDKAARLTSARDLDLVAGTCTRRFYGFDRNTNRTGYASDTPAAANCASATPPALARAGTYDSADRLVSTGYVYDNLGRTTALPGATIADFRNDLKPRTAPPGPRTDGLIDSPPILSRVSCQLRARASR